MLKKEYRIPRIKLVNPRIITTPYFILRFSRNNLLLSRFRFTVSKKIDKRAVVRNKMRRHMSHCIEQMFGRICGGFDMAFSLRAAAINKKEEVLNSAIIEVFEKQQIFI